MDKMKGGQMKNKNILLTLIGMILIIGIGLISAEVTPINSILGTYKIGECVTLYNTCADCTYMNFTSLLYPNGTLLLTNQNMTQSGEDYYFDHICLDQLGEYKYNTCGDLEGVVSCEPIYIYTTPTGGQESNLTTFVVMIILSVGLLLLAFIFKNNIFAFLSGLAFLGTGVYSMIYGFGDVYSTFTKIVAVFIIGFGMIIAITASIDEFSNNNEYVGYAGDDD
jgi:hypothetical protein